MEPSFETPITTKNQEAVLNGVHRVQLLFIGFAEKYLEQGDPLREYIVQYYSDSERLDTELGNVFRDLSEEEINERISAIEKSFTDPKNFIEYFEKIQERNLAKTRSKERSEREPLATDEEYEAGVYYEDIERQVADAVFELRRKGYNTFQSGFAERHPRDQFIDVYNKEIVIPDEIIENLKQLGFVVALEKEQDRTTIRIHPIKDVPIRLNEWKTVWNTFAAKMPKAVPEDFSSVKMYESKKCFQNRQDGLRG